MKVKSHTPYFMKRSISSKGQITVPMAIRENLGLLPGTAVRFEVLDGCVVIRKITRGPHPVDRLYGRLNLSRPVDRLLDEMRGPRRRGSGG